MASTDSEQALPHVQEQEGVDAGGTNKIEINNETKNTKKNKNKNSRSYFPRFGCFRIEHDDATGGSFDIEVVDASGQRPNPTHLIIMVNGLIGRLSFSLSQFIS